MEQHIAELSRRQRKQGVNVLQAYCVGDAEYNNAFKVLAGWPILHLWPHALRDVIFYAAVCWRAWRSGHRADVVHIHGDWSAYLCGTVLRRVVGARVLLASMHGHMPTGLIRRWLYRVSVMGVHTGYATGAREAKILTRLSGRAWANITSGIADIFFQPEAGETARTDVVTVGSLLPVKGIDLALEVARRLPQRRFQIIGDGSEKQRLVAAAKGLDNCEFVGRLDRDGVAKRLRGSRLMLLTSLREGTPTAALEAMASGLPVVTTSSNDYGLLLGHDGGAVVPGRDADSVAAAVEAFLSDEARLKRAGARNMLAAEEYSWDAVARRVTDLMLAAKVLANAGKKEQ